MERMERGDETWPGILDRLVNKTYVSRHSSLLYMFFVARTHKKNEIMVSLGRILGLKTF
jgi:hypothetical protein